MKLEPGAPRGAYRIMDTARATAAMLVVASHVRDLLMTDYRPGLNPGFKLFYFMTGFGHAGVIVFFVLSGFWISKTTRRRAAADTGLNFWSDYLVDRLVRLCVVLWPALLIGGLLDTIGIYLLDLPVYRGMTGAQSINAFSAASLSLTGLFINLGFLQSLAGPPFGSNGPLWSLAYEFWFYLWFPALWLLGRWRRPGVMLLTLLLGVVWPALAFGFVSWLAGAALYWSVERTERMRIPRTAAWVVMYGGVISFVIAMAAIRLYPFWWLDPLVAFAFAWLLLGLCMVDMPAPRALRLVERYGAKSSFSLYAMHYPVAALCCGLLTMAGRWTPSLGSTMLVIMLLGGAILAGLLLSWLTEAHTPVIRAWIKSADRWWRSG